MDAAFVLLLATLPSVLAQVAPTASLAGAADDPSGAAIPAAQITVLHEATGFERAVTTGSDGKYFFASLPVGLYNLRAAAAGFSTYEQKGIRLTVNTPATVNITLKIGALAESVTVSADATMVNTQSGALSQVVQQRYIQELPLNGRNAAALVRMVPGVVNGVGTTTAGYANSGETIAISVNGSRGNEVNYRLDGATHMDNVTNLNATYPNPDALEEFSVQTSNYSAQYGNFSGAVVNIVSRSGGNSLHGSWFHFVRNGAMNARNFFASQPDNLKRNQLGGTIGGPIRKNRLFYFASYQATIIRNESFTNTAFVPSEAMRRGDFRELGRRITDPAANQPFPNDTMPANRILPIASNLLKAVPASAAANGLLRYARPDRSESQQALGKADYHWSRHHLSGSMFYVRLLDPGWDGGGTLLTARIGQRQTTRDFKAQDVFTIRPNLINTIVASGLMLNSYNVKTSTFWLSQFGPIRYTEPPEADRQLELGVTGYGGWGSVTNSPPGQWIRRNVEINDTLTWTSGRHTIYAGGEYTPYVMFDSYTRFQQSGNFTFSGQITGNGISDLLLGKTASFVQSAGKFKQTRGVQTSLFVEDTFRAASGLNLTFGLRWDPYLPYHDNLDQVAGFREGARSERFRKAPPGAIFAGDADFQRAGTRNDLDNLAPRFGFAWTPRVQKLISVVRGGYGIFIVRPFPRLYNNFVEAAPFSPTISLNGVDMQDPYGSSAVRNPFPPFAPIDLANKDIDFSFPMPYAWFSPAWGAGYSQAWNLTIERQLRQNWLLRLAYVGNKGTHLQSFRERNAAVYGPSATVGNTNARRPRAPYFASMRELVDTGISNYHAFQVTLDKRFSRSFSILTFYTFSKSIDDESVNNQFTFANPHPTDQRFNRGLSDFDLRHNFRMSGVFDLPKLAGLIPVARRLAGGWTLLSIFDLRTGLPFGLSSGRDNSFSGMSLDRADILGNPALPSDRPAREKLARYFDASLVRVNAVGTYGNSTRNFLRAPGVLSLDLAIEKNLAFTERFRFQLRGEFFNALNHANFGQPGANASSTANFGVINGAGDPRILQIGARLSF
ncbi:MAG: carboxypeptidase regulatory-like domain-containing protein [Acidobacteria bacterium]|nr:carboxypeptidase regulatory-like domain-containing protein [Acidobacteriota bacterium]